MRKRTPYSRKNIAIVALATFATAGGMHAAFTSGAASKAFDMVTTSHHSCASQFGKADTRMTWNGTSLTLVDPKGETVYESVSVKGYTQLRTQAESFCVQGILPKLRAEIAGKHYGVLGTYNCTARNGRTAEVQEYSNGIRLTNSNGALSFGQLNFHQARKEALAFCNG